MTATETTLQVPKVKCRGSTPMYGKHSELVPCGDKHYSIILIVIINFIIHNLNLVTGRVGGEAGRIVVQRTPPPAAPAESWLWQWPFGEGSLNATSRLHFFQNTYLHSTLLPLPQPSFASAFLSHPLRDSRSPSQMASSSSSPQPICRLFCWDPLGTVCEEVDGVKVAMRQGEVDIDEAAGV